MPDSFRRLGKIAVTNTTSTLLSTSASQEMVVGSIHGKCLNTSTAGGTVTIYSGGTGAADILEQFWLNPGESFELKGPMALGNSDSMSIQVAGSGCTVNVFAYGDLRT